MKTIEFDDSAWPVVKVTYSSNVDEGEFETLLDLVSGCQSRALREGQMLALIYDATSGYSASARVRRRQAEWIEEHKQATKDACAGIAFVFDSVVVRGVLTAILWMSEVHAPHKVFGTLEAASEWASLRVQAARTQRARLGS